MDDSSQPSALCCNISISNVDKSGLANHAISSPFDEIYKTVSSFVQLKTSSIALIVKISDDSSLYHCLF